MTRPIPTFPYNSGTGTLDSIDFIQFAAAWNLWAEEQNAAAEGIVFRPDFKLAAGRRILIESEDDDRPPFTD